MKLSKSHPIKQTRADTVFDIINIVIMLILLVIFIYPLWFVVIASFSSPNEVLAGNVYFMPVDITLEGYKMIFEYEDIWIGYRNTIIYVLVGAPLQLTITVMVSYSLSRKDFMPRNVLMALFTVTMFFGGGLIPTYLLLKDLSMLDTMWALIVPGGVSVYNIIVTRTYFQSNIPEELREAAMLDGCTDTGFFTRIVLPLSKPILAVMFLFSTVAIWNMFFNARMYLKSRELYPLQLVLSEIVTSSNLDPEMLAGMSASQAATMMNISNSIRYGSIVVGSLPVLCLYPFVQKYFVKGIMVGAIKG